MKIRGKLCLFSVFFLLTATLITTCAFAQDDYDDPPTRVARLGYIEGSVSFQPAGENDWVGAVPNRPMTTGDQLWADQDSRAEIQLGSAVIRLSANTGVSFLNLDDHTIQVQLSSGSINVTVRRLNDNDTVEIDTPNIAFTAFGPGHYRIDADSDGSETSVGIRAGEGQATGAGQAYSLRAGQIGYFSGTDNLYGDVEQVGDPDPFDAWVEARDHRYDYSRSMHYLSPEVVGFEDLDDYGDWRNDPEYGNVWFPNRVDAGWAPYHTGHWVWIDPWGYTWVDDSPWGYAPFHYGRWVSVGGRWGWIAGPPAVAPVYAPALVVFIGGGGGWGGNIGWFPLGPREVYVPTYPVSRAYMTQVNVSNTVVNTTVITNVYNTTIINKTTNITNITYANRTVQGAVVAVPQNAFAGAQPVARTAVAVNAQQIAAAPMVTHAAVVPTRAAVLGAKANTAGHVTAPPAAVMSRAIVAKKTPPPPPVSFAAKQQALAAHPGQPVAKQQLATLRPASAPASRPAVRVAPAAKPATPTSGHPPASVAAHPGQPAPAGQPANRPSNNQPVPNRPAANQPPANQPSPNRAPATQPENRPEMNRPAEAPARPTPAPNNRPEANPAPSQPSPRPSANQPQPNNRPETNRPTEAPAHPAPQPNNRPEANQPENNRPAPEAYLPPTNQPNRNEPAARPQMPPPQQQHAAPPPKQAPKPQPKTPEEKKKEEEQKKPSGI